jgi:hypothetical protein
MMLLVAIAIWLTLIVFFVALCRGAASADGRDLASAERYPSGSAGAPRTHIAGLVLLEDRPATDLRAARARGARGRAGQYVAGS